MQIFSAYSKSHRVFLDEYFLPSLEKFEPGLDVHCVEIPQLSDSGDFHSPGFLDTVKCKFQMLWEFAVTQKYGSLILCSDCDIQFFGPFRKDLEGHLAGYDIVFQTNRRIPLKLNNGFFCLRWCPAVRSLISTMLNSMEHFSDDEVTMNHLLRDCGFPVRHKLLPPEDYWTIVSSGAWEFRAELVPAHPLMHHGNGVVGIDAKLELLRQVRDLVNARGTSGATA